VNRKGPFDPREEAHLLSAFVDGELEPDDEARIRAHLEENQDTRREVEQLRRLNALTGHLRLKEPPPEVWEVFWQSVYNRAERSVGWILLAVGAVVLGAWVLLQVVTALLATPDVPLVVKGAIFVLAAGMLTLLVSVIRERVYRRSRTRYKDVQR
jgi:anti-sigma factor RsiW